MKIFKVLDTIESAKLANGYPGEYYDVDGKICFKVKVFEEVNEYIVKAWSEEAIIKRFGRKVEIEFLEDDHNVFNKAAPQDYINFISNSKTISRIFLRFEDKACAPEVQERYKEDPFYYLNRPRVMQEW